MAASVLQPVIDVKRVSVKQEKFMRSMIKLMKQLKSDEDGASLIEYTVLLGVMLVAVIATIVAVGGWVNTQWTALNGAI